MKNLRIILFILIQFLVFLTFTFAAEFTLISPSQEDLFTNSNSFRIEWIFSENSSCNIIKNSNLERQINCNGNSLCNYNLNINDGINKWEVICDGVSSGINNIIKPKINIETPLNNQRFSLDNNILLKWSIEPKGYNYICHIHLNSLHNGSYVSSESFFHELNSLPNGIYSWRVFCSSPDGRDFSSPLNFFRIDVLKPEVNLISPSNRFVSFSNNNQFTWEVNKDLTCGLYVRDELRATTTCSSLTSCSQQVQVEDGLHEWYVSCYDSLGQLGISQTRFIQIDVLPQGYVSNSCGHGGTRSSDSTTYTVTVNTSFGTNSRFDYILPPNSEFQISQISANNFLCSNGYSGLNTPFVVFWKYNYGNFVEYLSNGFKLGNNIDRNSLIGPTSSTIGYKPGEFYTWNSGGSVNLLETIKFNEIGQYELYSDMVNAICDSPGYICPDLQGNWRSNICRVGQLSTVSRSDGWRELSYYNILVFDGNDIEVEFPSFDKGNLNIVDGDNSKENLIQLDISNNIPFDLNLNIVDLSCYDELDNKLNCNLLSPTEVIIPTEEKYKLLFTLNSNSDDYVGWPNVYLEYILTDNLGIDEFTPKREVKILSPIHFKGNYKIEYPN